MHVIAAKAVAFKEALQPDFKAYQQQVAKNAIVLAETLTERGLRIVSGRTESHLMLVDLRPKNLTGKEAETVLQAAHMTCNKNGIPNDPQKPMVTSGIRLGTPALTTRGFGAEETRRTAHLIADVLDAPHDEANIAAVRAKVATSDPRLPRLPLKRDLRCAAPSAATKTRPSSRRAIPTRATSSAGAAAARAATSASPPTSMPRSPCRRW